MKDFDWRAPDYPAVFRRRVEALNRMRAAPADLPALKRYYRDNPAQFITDWGCLHEPRNPEIGLPSMIPFMLFPRQVEWIDWVLESWKGRRPGVCAKSRESGVSWLAVSLSCTLCLFHEGVSIGWGSRKEELVDKLGDPKTLFWKAREFMRTLPVEFRGSFDLKTDSPHMRMQFRDTGSFIGGEAGSNIGRGARSSLYFVDEADFIEHPDQVDAALSQTTNCRIDISTPNGSGRPFHRKVLSWPKDRVFLFHWRDDKRKDQAWYDKQVADIDNDVIIAQELDIDFAAAAERILIPSAWVQAAIDAHTRLGIYPTGARTGSLDVADEGADKNAFCGAHGVLVETLEEWTGKGSDPFATTVRAFGLCEGKYTAFKYDSDGIGANVRGDARVINEERKKAGKGTIHVEAFRGSAAPFDPEGQDVPGRLNKDYFLNCKAQAWWRLRRRFQVTYQAVTDNAPCKPDDIISLSSSLPLLGRLCNELSQPTYDLTTVGKLFVDKQPDGTRSPNLADAVMMQFSKTTRSPMIVTPEMLARA